MQMQVTGQLTGLEARNGGWFAAAITEQGQQYPRKLSTKKPELVQMCQQLMGQMVTCLYNESESQNINPNSGLPYMNRYLEQISLAGQMPQQPVQQQPVMQQPVQQQQWQQPVQQQPIMQQPPQQQAVIQHVVRDDEVREMRIMRQAAGKVAASLLPMLAPEDQNLASLVRVAEQLVGYFRDGVAWQTAPIQPQAQQGQPGGGSEYNPGYAAVPGMVPAQQQQQPFADDDIPF